MQNRSSKYPVMFIANPYVCFLVGMALAISTILVLYLIEIRPYVDSFERPETGVRVIMYGILALLYCYSLVIASKHFWGIIAIHKDRMEFHAPFRRSHRLYFNEIKHVGIDYGKVGGTAEFWIYFSCEPIPHQYIHNISRLPFKRSVIRIMYSNRTFKRLLKHTPSDFSKKLEKCNSTIKLYHLTY